VRPTKQRFEPLGVDEDCIDCRNMMTEIDAPLVKQLLRTQFPQWAELPVAPVENGGWDNRTFRLGDSMSVRLPTALSYVAQVEKEHLWLPVLRPHLQSRRSRLCQSHPPRGRGCRGTGSQHTFCA
jgi:aminoglycoside phosphotransferase (APT) family kinase protein